MSRKLLFSLLMLATSATAALAQQPAAQCFPACRPGFACSAAGQCVSACNPPCYPGTVCSPGGQCVSACNPPCLAGQTCSGEGRCVVSQQAAPPGTAPQAPPAPGTPGPPPPVPAPAVVPPQAPPAPGTAPPPAVAPAQYPPTTQAVAPAPPYAQQPPPFPEAAPPAATTASPGWARGAAITGYVGAGVVALMTGLSIVFNEDDDEDPARGAGIAGTLTLGILGPVVAIGGASARRHPSVRGSTALRIVSWIGYGLALLDATALIIVSFEEEVASVHIASVGLLGTLSLVGFAIDASVSASSAERVGTAAAQGPSLSPRLSLRRELDGSVSPIFGIAGRL